MESQHPTAPSHIPAAHMAAVKQCYPAISGAIPMSTAKLLPLPLLSHLLSPFSSGLHFCCIFHMVGEIVSEFHLKSESEETLPPAFPSLNKTGLSLVLLSRKALDLHGHRLTHSPEGPRTCFSYLICSCWGFYTCVLDNLPRHCRSKKASFQTKDLKPPEGLSGSSVFQHIPLAFFLLSCSLCAFISFWAPTGLCSEAHYCWHKERQRRGGTSPGADPPGQAASFLLCGAMWDDLIQPQHVQHALSGV